MTYTPTLPPGGLAYETQIGNTNTGIPQIVQSSLGRTPGIPTTDFYIGASLSIDYADMATFDFDAYFAYCAQYGLYTIRLSFPWESFQPNLADVPAADAIAILTTADAAASKHGISIILDPIHNAGKRVVNGTTQYVGDGVVTANVFAQSWLQIAKAVSGYRSIVGYQLMWAPTLYGANITETTWVTCAQGAITQIRTQDTTKVILVDGFAASVAYHWSTTNPDLHTLSDPNDNLIFCARIRLDRDGSGSYYDWDKEVTAGDSLAIGGTALDSSVGKRRLADFITWCTTYNVKGMVQELAVSNDRGLDIASTYASSVFTQDVYGWDNAMAETVEYLKTNNIPLLMLGSGPQFWKSITDSLGVTWSRHPHCIDPITALYDTSTSAYVADYTGAMSEQCGVIQYFTQKVTMPTRYRVVMDTVPTQASTSANRVATGTVIVNGYVSRGFVVSLVREAGANVPGLSIEVSGTGTDSIQIPSGVNLRMAFAVLTATTATLEHTTAENQQVFKEPLIFTNNGGLKNPAPVILDPGLDIFSTLGITAQAIIWPRLMTTAYTGEAVKLTNKDESATQSFGFSSATLGAGIDTTSITNWSDTAYLVTYNDQSGNGNNLTTTADTTATDYPKFLTTSDTGLPAAQWGYTNAAGAGVRNRMSIDLPVGTSTDYAVMFAVDVSAMDSSQAVLYWQDAQLLSIVSSGGTTTVNGTVIGSYPLIYDTTVLYTFAVTDGTYVLRKNGLTVATGTLTSVTTGTTTACQVGWSSTSTAITKMTFVGLVALKDDAAKSYYPIERALLSDLDIAPVSLPPYMGTSPVRLVDFTQVYNGNYTLLQYLSILGQWSDDMTGIVINGNISADALKVSTPENQIIHDVTLVINPDAEDVPTVTTNSDSISNKIEALITEISNTFTLIHTDYTSLIKTTNDNINALSETVSTLSDTVADNYKTLMTKIQDATGALLFTIVPTANTTANTLPLSLSGNTMLRYTITQNTTFQIVTTEDPGDGTVWPQDVASGNVVYAKATVLFVLDGVHTVTLSGTLGVMSLVGQPTLSMSSGSVVLTSGIPNKAGTVVVDFVTWDAGTTWYVVPVEATYGSMNVSSDNVSYQGVELTTIITSMLAQLSKATVARTKLLQVFVSVPPESDELLGSFIADTDYTYDALFNGSYGYADTPPDSPYTFTIQKVSSGATTEIGTIAVDLTGKVTFTGTAGSLVEGDLVRVVGSTETDPSMADVSIMLLFTQNMSSD